MRNRSLSHTVVYLCSALSMRTAHGATVMFTFTLAALLPALRRSSRST